MTRHTLAERLLIVLAVCGALTIFSLVGARLVPPDTGGFSFSVGRVSAALLTVLIVTVVLIGLALVLALRSRR
jgi:succinate dehydrogenase/fumarate reductase cytochrome b subunit